MEPFWSVAEGLWEGVFRVGEGCAAEGRSTPGGVIELRVETVPLKTNRAESPKHLRLGESGVAA
jgi:hypothetical protein